MSAIRELNKAIEILANAMVAVLRAQRVLMDPTRRFTDLEAAKSHIDRQIGAVESLFTE